jgi:hypothetical protein
MVMPRLLIVEAECLYTPASDRGLPRILDRVLGAHDLAMPCVPPHARRGDPGHASPRYARRGVQA